MTLKFENIAQIGDTVKAFDFQPSPGRSDRYVEGFVTETKTRFGARVFVIRCTFDSAFPEGNSRVGLDVLVPMETSMDFDGRVTLIDMDAEFEAAIVDEATH